MVEITYSQRKMLKHILKTGKKGVRWDELEKKFGETASPKELLELTQQGLLKALGASGNEWDLREGIVNLPEPCSLYSVCTNSAKEVVKRDDTLDRRDTINLILGIIGAIAGIIGAVAGFRR